MGRAAGQTRTPAPVALPATSADAVRGLWSSRPFRRMAIASGAASLGDWMGFLAIIALTADIMGPTRAAAFAVSGVMAARVVPSLLLAPVAGVFVDRWDRKRVLVITHVGRGLIMALIPFTQEVLALVLATLFMEVLSSMFGPAKDAVFPTLVRREQLMSANQINLILTYGMLPVAGVLYAVLVASAGRFATAGSFIAVRPIALPIWFNALTFLSAQRSSPRSRSAGRPWHSDRRRSASLRSSPRACASSVGIRSSACSSSGSCSSLQQQVS
jgi:dTMP kinase